MPKELVARPEDVTPRLYEGKDSDGNLRRCWQRILLGGNGEGQWVHITKCEPGYVLQAHYHPVDQFQIIVEGSGTLAGEPLTVGSVHFTTKNTPYGPIVAGPEGMTFMVIRPNTDHEAPIINVSTIIERVRAAQV